MHAHPVFTPLYQWLRVHQFLHHHASAADTRLMLLFRGSINSSGGRPKPREALLLLSTCSHTHLHTFARSHVHTRRTFNQKVAVPYNGEDLQWHPVTPELGKLSTQGPVCCRPLKPVHIHPAPCHPNETNPGGECFENKAIGSISFQTILSSCLSSCLSMVRLLSEAVHLRCAVRLPPGVRSLL